MLGPASPPDGVDPLAELRRRAESGTAPNAIELLTLDRVLVEQLVARFGSLGAARDAAGLRRGRPPETRESTLRAVSQLARLDVPIVPAELRRLGEEALVKATYEHFGSWERLRAAAGLRAPARRAPPLPSRDDVIAALHGAADARGVAQNRLSGPIVRAAKLYFGGVDAALAAARLPRSVGNQRWTRETLISALGERVRAGRAITLVALRSERRYDLVNAMHRHLGGARRAAQLVERHLQASAAMSAPVGFAPHDVLALRRKVTALTRQFVTRVAEVAHATLPREVTAERPTLSPPIAPVRAPAPFHDPAELSATVHSVGERCRLTPRAVDVLMSAVSGVPRRYLATSLHLSENTVKTHVQRILRATGHKDLDALVWWVREGAPRRRRRR